MKCGRCNKNPAVKGKYHCKECAEQESQRSKKYWKDHTTLLKKGKTNLCARCKKRPLAEKSTSRCEQCLEYARNKQYEYRNKG